MICAAIGNLIEGMGNKMRISLNWLQDYVDIKGEDPVQMADAITKAGVNVEGILRHQIPNLVVGYVQSRKDHPNSDHLNVCMVDLGDEVVQIVCGAKNVDAGQKVIVSKVGAVLPGDFEIKKSTIRGVESNGMICALSELGLEDSSDGICVLPEEAVVGSNPFVYLGLDDIVYDLDLNPNRNDCLSHLGFAYETAAVLDKKVTLPYATSHPIDRSVKDEVQVSVKTENCTMYRARMVSDVVIKESPDFIKQRLASAGMRSINNVVDISNYIMLEYGQPLHFFDKDKLGDRIVVRMAQEGEKTVTLDQKERTLTKDDVVITDGDHIVAIAGVMGGLDTEVDENTKNILIESAIFDPYHLRYTSIRLDLRSEASLRYEKGLNYEYCEDAINRACALLETYASGKVYRDEVVYDVVDKTPKVAEVTKERVNKILGMELTAEDILESFRKLDFPVQVDSDRFVVTIPNRRMDVAIREDLIEEIGRLYGFDKIVAKLPVVTMKRGQYNSNAKFRKDISKYLRGYGWNEVRTYTLVSEEESKQFAYQNKTTIALSRPMSSDKVMVRQSLLPSLVKVMDYNLKHQTEEIAIYELSNTYCEENDYEETLKLGFLVLGKVISNPWNSTTVTYDFYIVKGMVEELLDYLGLAGRYRFEVSENVPQQLHPGVSCEVLVDNERLGYFGMLHPTYRKQKAFVGELNLTKLRKKKVRPLKYKELNRYPGISKDMAFVLNREISSEEVIQTIKKAGGKLLSSVTVFDVYTGDKVKENEKSLAFQLTFEDATRTLTEEEVMISFHRIINEVEKKHQAILRDK